MTQFRVWQLAILAAALAPANAHAATRLGPVVTYDVFTRTTPEHADVGRLGGGARLSTDLGSRALSFEIEGLYSQEDDTFATLNTFSETVMRGRAGLLLTPIAASLFSLGFRGGPEYDRVGDSYKVTSTNSVQNDTRRYWTQYAGVELGLLPISGFGLRAGITWSYEKPVHRWVPQAFLGIVLR